MGGIAVDGGDGVVIGEDDHAVQSQTVHHAIGRAYRLPPLASPTTAATAICQGKGGFNTDELVVAADGDRPADTHIGRVEGNDLDFVGAVLIVLILTHT